jgi:thiol-disulfide isomerase/thioredoxin
MRGPVTDDDAKADAKLEAKADAKLEAKADAKLEAKADAKLEAKAADGAQPPAPALAPGSARAPGLFARLGLAIVSPRWALALAGAREHTGRSGSDLLAALALVIAATQLRGLATAVWLAVGIEPALGIRLLLRVLSGALTTDLGLLVLGGLVVFACAGPRRSLGRAFDLACVAVLPLLFVELGASLATQATGGTVPAAVRWVLSGLAVGWMGALLALAIGLSRAAPRRTPVLPAAAGTRARRAGLAVAIAVGVGIAAQAVWIAGNLDLIEPMRHGREAPGFALPRIEAGGKLGAPVALASTRGKITVLDFWATWCKPCLASMPRLEQLARAHSDVAVLAINTDDPAAARALFDSRGYTMTLVSDDGAISDRYGASVLPYTVIVDRSGAVREVIRGAGVDVEALVERLRAAP